MKIQVNTSNNVDGHAALRAQVEEMVAKSLSHVSSHITRVEVHLSDENADKSGPNDKRCTMEARVEGRQPTAVTCDATTLLQAVSGAADKLKSALDSTLKRQR